MRVLCLGDYELHYPCSYFINTTSPFLSSLILVFHLLQIVVVKFSILFKSLPR